MSRIGSFFRNLFGKSQDKTRDKIIEPDPREAELNDPEALKSLMKEFKKSLKSEINKLP